MCSFFYVKAQEVYRMDPVTDAYTTPDNGQLLLKTKDNLPRMADSQTKYVIRFDPFFFIAENENITKDDIVKAEVLIVSVLEGGLTGASRRVNDAEIMVYEVNNSWERNAYQPDPFEAETAIAGPIYYPGLGANDGTEDFMALYQAPVRIDITDFFKEKFESEEEFSIDFIKSSEYSAEFTRMGGVGQSDETKRSHMLITYNSDETSVKSAALSGNVKAWTDGEKIHVSISDHSGPVVYSLLAIDGRTIETRNIDMLSNKIISDASVAKGIYLVKLQLGGNTIVRKVINK